MASTLIDIAAFAVFLACWLGFGQGANWLARRRPSILTEMRVLRARWTEKICEREIRIADTTILSNLLRGVLFFASTTVLILGGLVALLGTTPTAIELVSQLPFRTAPQVWLWEVKTLILIGIFIYAFFQFTWSAWQYNIFAIALGAAPEPGDDHEDFARFIKTASRLAVLAGESYNNGIRAYYFSIPLLGWFIHPFVLLSSALIVTAVLYRREFNSPTLAALLSREGEKGPSGV